MKLIGPQQTMQVNGLFDGPLLGTKALTLWLKDKAAGPRFAPP